LRPPTRQRLPEPRRVTAPRSGRKTGAWTPVELIASAPSYSVLTYRTKPERVATWS